MGFSSLLTICKYSLYSGAGNRFLLSEELPSIQTICSLCEKTKTDGFLFLSPSLCADARLTIFNSDGSRPAMCGNGLRCVIAHLAQRFGRNDISVDTDCGVYSGYFYSWERVLVDMSLPEWHVSTYQLKLANFSHLYEVFFVHTGVPHAVLFFPELTTLDILSLGRFLRHHPQFAPQGVNVNFVEVLGIGKLRLRTYERGLEKESPACGTGAVAATLAVLKCYEWQEERVELFTWHNISMAVNLQQGRVYLEGPVTRFDSPSSSLCYELC
ncbi:bifunctional diaminopimelate epimerase/glutamate racemase [Candidatus Chlamydia sanziniae]|uniref:Diaminopimelate epimerase n=1 Tax=Candidatus Chlamydia sanziniae TaxID=1806891 RepID=A0A1A9HW93_9CHLA|nr:bifunctional diaminopimelate epimerase/glutamate racemase [Candidatus Chlamydia sanziniae]ANH78314.1 Diaminopimelate epimerase [Candidatus Chlamydia sanziniae]